MSARHARPEPVVVRIESLSHEGRGIARLDGKTVFVEGALPGELARVEYARRKNRYDQARVLEILEPAESRITPRCPHFGVCGGCSLQHLAPEAQLELKQNALQEQLAHIGGIEPAQWAEPLRGPCWGYRRRARLGIRYVAKKASLLLGFREKHSHFLTDMHRCEVLAPVIGERIAELRALLGELSVQAQLAQLEVALGDNAAALVLRNLAPLSEADAEKLAAYAREHDLHFYQQPGGLDSIAPLWPRPAPALSYAPGRGEPELLFGPSDFVQVNAEVNRQMVAVALDWLAVGPADEVLELFCGLGNFTLPLARRVARVVAVEGEAALIRRAEANARHNHLDNIQYHVANLADPGVEGDWLSGGYSRILLDPPRSGALEIIQRLPIERLEKLLYISCNPATLARDAGELGRKGLRLTRVGIMDMFPHTAHVESIALFEPK